MLLHTQLLDRDLAMTLGTRHGVHRGTASADHPGTGPAFETHDVVPVGVSLLKNQVQVPTAALAANDLALGMAMRTLREHSALSPRQGKEHEPQQQAGGADAQKSPLLTRVSASNHPREKKVKAQDPNAA
jgi:hypothetical protein